MSSIICVSSDIYNSCLNLEFGEEIIEDPFLSFAYAPKWYLINFSLIFFNLLRFKKTIFPNPLNTFHNAFNESRWCTWILDNVNSRKNEIVLYVCFAFPLFNSTHTTTRDT